MMDKIRGGESLTGRVFCVYAKVEVSAHTHTHNKHTVKTQLLSLNTKSVADDVENLWIIHQTRFKQVSWGLCLMTLITVPGTWDTN